LLTASSSYLVSATFTKRVTTHLSVFPRISDPWIFLLFTCHGPHFLPELLEGSTSIVLLFALLVSCCTCTSDGSSPFWHDSACLVDLYRSVWPFYPLVLLFVSCFVFVLFRRNRPGSPTMLGTEQPWIRDEGIVRLSVSELKETREKDLPS
jgi:hypothetical protein